MKVYLIGPYPPPYGGISIHLKRLLSKLNAKERTAEIYCSYSELKKNKEIKIDYVHFLSFKRILLKVLFTKRKVIIHSHIVGGLDKIIYGLFCIFLKKTIIVTFHGEGVKKYYSSLNVVMKKLFKFCLKNLSRIIVVNEDLKNWCLSIGINKDKVSVIPAYLNPVPNKEDYNQIDSNVWAFINEAHQNKERIITANGNIRFFNNQDLYGLDLLIEMIKKLRKCSYNVVLVFALLGYQNQNKKEREYFNSLELKIKEYKLEKYIMIYKVNSSEYYPLLENADIFVRPTNTDGDAISLRESLYLKKPCLASDVVKRPEGVILFRNRDLSDLIKKTMWVLDNYDECLDKLKKIQVKEYFEDIKEVYTDICNRKNIKEE